MAEPGAQQVQDDLVDGTDEARMATPQTRMSAAMEVADHDTSAMHLPCTRWLWPSVRR